MDKPISPNQLRLVLPFMLAAWSMTAIASPVQVVCTGTMFDAKTGHQMANDSKALTFTYEFDQANQTFADIETRRDGSPFRESLDNVSISDALATGHNKTARFNIEINRIEGTLTVRFDQTMNQLGKEPVVKGNCAPTGKAKF